MVVEYRDGKRTEQLVLHVNDSGGQTRFLALLELLHAPQARRPCTTRVAQATRVARIVRACAFP